MGEGRSPSWFKARSHSLFYRSHLEQWLLSKSLPDPATLNSQEQIHIPLKFCCFCVNRAAVVCTMGSHDLRTIHGKLLNSLVWRVLHRALHGANMQDQIRFSSFSSLKAYKAQAASFLGFLCVWFYKQCLLRSSVHGNLPTCHDSGLSLFLESRAPPPANKPM